MFGVRKLDLDGREIFAYHGRLLTRTPQSVVLEARFERYDRLDLGCTVFERGDRFVEFFYADRWYNVFAVYAAGSGALRGWYCNITRPALIEADQVSSIDLALDLWVNPDGSTVVLDEGEFTALALPAADRAAAHAALRELQQLAARQAWPFDTNKKPPGRTPSG